MALHNVRVLRSITGFRLRADAIEATHLQPAENLVPASNYLDRNPPCNIRGWTPYSFSASACSPARTSLSTHALRLTLCRALHLRIAILIYKQHICRSAGCRGTHTLPLRLRDSSTSESKSCMPVKARPPLTLTAAAWRDAMAMSADAIYDRCTTCKGLAKLFVSKKSSTPNPWKSARELTLARWIRWRCSGCCQLGVRSMQKCDNDANGPARTE